MHLRAQYVTVREVPNKAGCKDETTPLDGTNTHRSINGVVGNNAGVQNNKNIIINDATYFIAL